ncbi:MAG: hypothetical protein ACYTGB_20310 [Planctomycetota bacterium]
MSQGICDLLAYPLSVPPVKRSRLERFAPEVAAAAVWLLFAWLCVRGIGEARLGLWEMLGLSAGRLSGGGVPAAGLLPRALAGAAQVSAQAAGLLMLAAPPVFVAASFAAERERGTLESIILTSAHHNRVVRGRFWFVSLPWLRLGAYLLPLYVLVGLEPILTMSCSGWSAPWLNLLGWLSTAGRQGGRFIWNDAVTPSGTVRSLFLAGMRWLHDFSAMFLCIGATFWISLRARTTIRAAVLGFLAAPVLVGVLFSPDFVWVLMTRLSGGAFLGRPVQYYWLAALAVMAARWGAVSTVLNRASRNFEAYVLGEKPDAGDARPGRRRGRRIRGYA